MGKSLASLGCLFIVLGLSLPILMFCGIAVVATLEKSIGTFLAWTLMGLLLAGIALVIRSVIVKMRD